MSRAGLLALLSILVTGGQGFAADPRYPDWPCAQAKVPEISLAAVWAGPPLDDTGSSWKDDQQLSDLVNRLAARRTPLDEAEELVTDYLAGGDRIERGKRLFAGLFETMNTQRASVMSGLERVTRKQRAAAEAIRTETAELQAAQADAAPDQAKIEQLNTALTWQTRIFEDRRQTIRFVCEVPVTIDQRLFALARTVQQAIE